MTYEEILNLGKLVKINISKEESAELIPNMDSILGYIDQIQEVEIDTKFNAQNSDNSFLFEANNLRDDSNFNAGDFRDDFMSNVPVSENNLVKVPKVLNND